MLLLILILELIALFLWACFSSIPPKTERAWTRGKKRWLNRSLYSSSQLPPLPRDDNIDINQFVRKYKKQKNINRKAAVLIGINYVGEEYALEGCINDVHNMENLMKKNGFNEILILTDESPLKPTGENMRHAMRWLVESAKNGDSMVLHYSGHGSTSKEVQNTDAAQADTIVPLDWPTNGMIQDSELYQLLVRPLDGTNAHLMVVFDSCHSGSALDLTYNYKVDPTSPDLLIPLPLEHHSPLNAHVVLLSGSLDTSLSNDISDGNTTYGAMTHVLVGILSQGSGPPLPRLLVAIQKELNRQEPDLHQTPQLSSEIPLTNTARFFSTE